MPRTKKCNNKKYTHTRRVRKGGGFMNLIRSKKKYDDKSKIDLIILALGGMDEVIRRAKSNEDKLKEKLKNEVQNPLVDDDKKDVKSDVKSDVKFEEQRPPDPIGAKPRTPPQVNQPMQASAANMPIGAAVMPPMVESRPPSSGGRRTKRRN